MHERKHIRSRVAAALAVVTAALAAGSGDAFAQCQYEVTAILDIGDCDIGDSHTFGQGMNNSADVVGYYRFCAVGNERAFFWSQETGFITLPHPDGVVRSWAYDISDNRIIVGQHEFTGIGRKGFAYDMATGEYKHLEPLHEGATATNVSSANAVNNAGVVAGMRIIGKSGNTPHNAVIWDTNTGEVIDLGVMEGPNSTSNSLNESLVVVGSSGASATSSLGFMHTESTIMFPPISDGISSLALDVSESAVACGGGHIVIDGQTIAHGGIWQDAWIVVIEPPSGFAQVAARHMNDVNQVILMATQPGGISRPFLWQHGGVVDVNTLKTSGPLLTHPSDINNQGQILARASTRAVLLTPIDVPVGDLNFDCKVDGHDLAILLDAWGPQPITRGADGPQPHPADLNGDGVVDGTDLLILLANWNP